MADGTSIEWTDATWNPVTGCAVVSPGCTNCYAMRLAGTRLRNHPSRAGLTRQTKAGPVWTGEVRLNEAWLYQPLAWTRPRRIFVCAHGDLFAEGVPLGWIMRVFEVMGRATQHTFQVLTKRPDRMLAFLQLWADVGAQADWDFKDARGPEAVRKAHPFGRGELFADMLDTMGEPPSGCAYPIFDWAGGMSHWPDVLPNIWMGFSAEDQRRFDDRWTHVEKVAGLGWLTWLSGEPLLGPVDLGHAATILKWVVAGGESGPGARPMHVDWVRALRDQCAEAGTPFLFKQWGNWMPVPWKLERDAGETDADYIARSDAACSQTAISRQGYRHDMDHKPWSAERVLPAPATHHAVKRVDKALAGRMLDGVTHDAFPEAHGCRRRDFQSYPTETETSP